MAGLAQARRRSFLKPLALAFGALLLAAALLVGGWLLWVLVLRSPPAGFAPSGGQAVGVAGQGPDLRQYTVDARDRREWAYFDFSAGTYVATTRESPDWDLAFRRTSILANGGETNPAGLAGAVDLGEIPLDQAVPPADGYLADTTDDERELQNPALRKWYNYNWTTHIITSKGHTYALRTATGDVVLLTFLSYYCDDGSPGCITFQYAYPDGP
ncbi:MAG: HmuY family protein [Chloroflexi bacterium]|nr:HmuY family protein [Chloroflexota bacterium]